MSLSRRLSALPLADQVYETLQDGMLEGSYPPGTHLVQDAIAEQLGVSRTPVRDALIRLAHDELIVAAGARGYTVTEPPIGSLGDLLEIRRLLEPAGAAAALDYMSERDFRYLGEVNAQFTEHPDATGRQLFEFNHQFHMGLVHRCPNALLVEILESCWSPPRSRWVWKKAFEHGFDMSHSVQEHEEIIDIARRRDGELLETVLRAHIRTVQDEVFAHEDTSRGTD